MESKYTGKGIVVVLMSVGIFLLNCITLGLLWPITACWKFKYEANHTIIDGRKVIFTGNAGKLYGKYIIWLLFSIITFGIYYLTKMKINLIKWQTKNTIIEGDNGESKFDGKFIGLFCTKWLASLVSSITLGIGAGWSLCYYEKWFVKHKKISGYDLKFDGTAGQMTGKLLLWILLTIVTLGVYSIFLVVNIKKWVTKHTHLGGYNPSTISQDGTSMKNIDDLSDNKQSKQFKMIKVQKEDGDILEVKSSDIVTDANGKSLLTIYNKTKSETSICKGKEIITANKKLFSKDIASFVFSILIFALSLAIVIWFFLEYSFANTSSSGEHISPPFVAMGRVWSIMLGCVFVLSLVKLIIDGITKIKPKVIIAFDSLAMIFALLLVGLFIAASFDDYIYIYELSDTEQLLWDLMLYVLIPLCFSLFIFFTLPIFGMNLQKIISRHSITKDIINDTRNLNENEESFVVKKGLIKRGVASFVLVFLAIVPLIVYLFIQYTSYIGFYLIAALMLAKMIIDFAQKQKPISIGIIDAIAFCFFVVAGVMLMLKEMDMNTYLLEYRNTSSSYYGNYNSRIEYSWRINSSIYFTFGFSLISILLGVSLFKMDTKKWIKDVEDYYELGETEEIIKTYEPVVIIEPVDVIKSDNNINSDKGITTEQKQYKYKVDSPNNALKEDENMNEIAKLEDNDFYSVSAERNISQNSEKEIQTKEVIKYVYVNHDVNQGIEKNVSNPTLNKILLFAKAKLQIILALTLVGVWFIQKVTMYFSTISIFPYDFYHALYWIQVVVIITSVGLNVFLMFFYKKKQFMGLVISSFALICLIIAASISRNNSLAVAQVYDLFMNVFYVGAMFINAGYALKELLNYIFATKKVISTSTDEGGNKDAE